MPFLKQISSDNFFYINVKTHEDFFEKSGQEIEIEIKNSYQPRKKSKTQVKNSTSWRIDPRRISKHKSLRFKNRSSLQVQKCLANQSRSIMQNLSDATFLAKARSASILPSEFKVNIFQNSRDFVCFHAVLYGDLTCYMKPDALGIS